MKYFTFLILIFYGSFGFSQTNLMNVEPWAYWLQDINIQAIANNSSFEIIVFDYSADGGDSEKWSVTQIDSVKNSGKYAISYISIGEAEDYRYYWQQSWNTSPPTWLGQENPNWAGNYAVHFWNPDWQLIVFNYLDTILAQGYDGIYMDLIDAYYYWSVENPQQPFADSLMCQFVVDIRTHCDSVRGNNSFIILPQNGSDVMDQANVSTTLKTAYFNAINGIGVEDVFFGGELDENNPYNPDTYRIGILQQYLQNNKQVYAIDYLTDPAKIVQFETACATNNFIPYVCTRPLDNLCGGIITEISDINILDTELKISPNPASAEISITLSKPVVPNNYKIKITNSLGLSFNLLSFAKNEKELFIDISKLTNGIYFIQYQNSEKIMLGKFVKIN